MYIIIYNNRTIQIQLMKKFCIFHVVYYLETSAN